ncbi:MAG: ankyrin repeat domain-containing protein [Thermodesulfobacteriota bacterium]
MICFVGCSTPLIRAVPEGDAEKITRMIRQGADVNEADGRGFTPLMQAAVNGRVEIARLLMDSGADVNKGNTLFGTPLILAAEYGRADLIRLFLDRGADMNATKFGGDTPLSWAAFNGKTEAVRVLLERGADADHAIAISGPKGAALIEKVREERNRVNVGQAQAGVVQGRGDNRPVSSDVDHPPFAKAMPKESAYAVVIGIEEYQAIPRSDYSRKDAETMKAYLAALGFQERNIELMTDQRATRSGMAKALEAWLPNQVTNQSTVFVYFSGHGAPEPATGEAYLVPYDGDPSYLGVTGYSLKRLYDSLGKLPAKEVIVVLDSCFSGAGGRSVLAKGARPLVMTASSGPLPSRMAVLTAAQGSQISTSAPDKGHGVLTYYFLRALKDGKTDLADIYTTIKPQVEDAARRLNVKQSPSLAPDADTIKNRFSLIE